MGQPARPNGVATNYQYDVLSRLTSVLHQVAGKKGNTTLDGATYVYDAAGNRTSKTDNRTNVTSTFSYDPLYELTQVQQGTTTTESYSYDPVGNRLSSLGVSPYDYNNSNELTSTPSTTYIYDSNGNTLTKVNSSGTTQYTWDFENRLTSVVLPGSGGDVSLKYDPAGRRIQKSSGSGTTDYLYDDHTLLEEIDNGGNLLGRYIQGPNTDEHLAEVRSGTTSYYEQDGLNTVTSLSNSSAVLSNVYSYDSFGNVTAFSGSITNPFRYTGRDFDQEIGISYYRARYYDPQAGRFISEDPIRFAAGRNFYAYARGGPVNFNDPSGLCFNAGLDNIGCNTVLPDGSTIGDRVRALSDDLNGRTQTIDTPYGPISGANPLTVISDVYNGTNFKMIFRGKANAVFLGDAGNFAYGAVAHNIGVPLSAAELAAGAYSITHHPAEQWVGPYGMDPSANNYLEPGYRAQCTN